MASARETRSLPIFTRKLPAALSGSAPIALKEVQASRQVIKRTNDLMPAHQRRRGWQIIAYRPFQWGRLISALITYWSCYSHSRQKSQLSLNSVNLSSDRRPPHSA